MSSQTARWSAQRSVAAWRWPYRVIGVESPSQVFTAAARTKLLAGGIDLRPYEDGPSALIHMMAEDPAAVFAPTDVVGVDLRRFIRAVVAWSDVPIVIGTTGDRESHQRAFSCLEAGGRGILGLPFTVEQFSSTVRRLGLTRTGSAARLRYGPVELDQQAHQVYVWGAPVRLAPREFSLVEYLLAEAPRVVSSSEIAAVIGDPQLPGTMRVRKYVQNLRRKLGEANPDRPSVLETVRGIGYRLGDPGPAEWSDPGTGRS